MTTLNPALGVVLLLLALASTVYALAASLIGARKNSDALVESARNAAIITWPLLTLACVLLILLLVSGRFDVSFVWAVTDRAMPTYLKVTALWGGQAGSLLFWSWLMSSFTAAAMLRNWERQRYLMPYVIGASMGTLAFFILLVTFWENPFARYWQYPNGEVLAGMFGPSALLSGISTALIGLGEKLPGLLGIIFKGLVPFAPPPGSLSLLGEIPDGQGLNPLLRHPGMIIHPPMLYLGFVSFVVPYSFAMGALARGETDPGWIHATRRWSLVAWLFLSLGLILGGWWAYDVLGWGGYWGWDPVENAAFMPWLTGTAFLHSVMIQEKRGMMKRWNMVLITLTYLQVIIGTFLTRSGVLSSVHSFAQSAIGPLFFLFVAGALVISVVLLINRWDDLAAERQFDSLLSRETLFLFNNFLFVVINIAVAIGTYWPLVTELLADVIPTVEKASVGPPYYNAVTAPLFLGLIILMGVAPLVGWGTASARRLGRAMLIPAGVAVLLVVGMVIAMLTGLAALNAGAIAGYGFATLAALVTVLEFHKGAQARVQSHQENYFSALKTLIERNRRRYGGYMIHLGVVIMAIGIISSYGLQTETQQAVAAGQTITLDGFVVQYDGLERFVATDGRSVARVNVIVYRNDREVARLSPRIDFYEGGERSTLPGIYTTITGDDLYIRLVDWEQVELSSATIKVYHNPLVNWVWGGGLIFIVSTLVAAWPDFSEERQPSAEIVPARRRARKPVGAGR